MIVLFLHGPPAVGKLTVAEELSKLTGIQLFHNHIVVDAALEKFEFGSDGFKKYRAEAWLEAFETAAQNNKSFIFTFNPEKTVDPALIHQLVEQVEKHDGSVLFIELKADHNTLVQRLNSESRQKFNKLKDVALFEKLTEEGFFDFPMPENFMEVDTQSNAPEVNAQLIADRLSSENV